MPAALGGGQDFSLVPPEAVQPGAVLTTYKTVKAHTRQSRHIQDSQGQILALAFRLKCLNLIKLFPLCSEADRADVTERLDEPAVTDRVFGYRIKFSVTG